MGLDTKYDIDQMMEEWRINGFVVFKDLIRQKQLTVSLRRGYRFGIATLSGRESIRPAVIIAITYVYHLSALL